MGFRRTNRSPPAPNLQRNAFAEDAASAVVAEEVVVQELRAYTPPVFFPEDGGADGWVIPGPQGPAGSNGVIGRDGQNGIPGFDGVDGEDAWTVPGPQGAPGNPGAAGAVGPQGPIGFGVDGLDGEMGMPIPGLPGPAGAAGPQGATGPQGPIGLPGFDGVDGESAWPILGPQGPQGNPGTGGSLTLIQEVTTSGSQSNVTFSSISNAYRDLRVIIRGRGDTANVFSVIDMQFNGDTGSNYSYEEANTGGATWNTNNAASATLLLIGAITGATAPANQMGVIDVWIYNYAGTTFYKTVIENGMRRDTTGANQTYVEVMSGSWNSTAAINSVKVFCAAGNFVNGSVVSLYGSL